MGRMVGRGKGRLCLKIRIRMEIKMEGKRKRIRWMIWIMRKKESWRRVRNRGLGWERVRVKRRVSRVVGRLLSSSSMANPSNSKSNYTPHCQSNQPPSRTLPLSPTSPKTFLKTPPFPSCHPISSPLALACSIESLLKLRELHQIIICLTW